MVSLEWYRTFKEIYENGTLTKAAAALYTSQPGVSVHLNALEAYTGQKLFKRTSRKMIPTEEGKFLYEYIIDAVKQLEIAEQHFKKSTQKKKPSVHIGMCSEMFQHVIESEISKLNFNLVAKFGMHGDLIKDLNNGILDLVITPKTQSDKKSLVEYIPFSKEKIILIAGIHTDTTSINLLLKQKNWKGLEEELQKKTWYSASNEMEHFRRFWFENFKRRPAFKPNFILPNISSIIRCLSNKSGYALVPDFLCDEAIKNNQIKLIWEGTVNTENTLYFATRTDLQHKEEVDVLQELFKQKM
ncbi:DNA-binding transcriptional LysR family regulator [Wenyingzhuangia heitensis]|uniref:DNA-binding transcriptional LysR family regulator n=1 Tax=Wenyingzhuangia heitensis TaxID=1487859 RepID=A0ABX0U6T1_9FLAO|nr:LysR family transcriptional regulator [Wenyingzhuangia heitensis]NIJ44572.1 DNA-binding transcriptional LysR family regulator [Wenyingzhuangia heitensis]